VQRHILPTVKNFGYMALKVADVRFEVIALPYIDCKKVVVVPLGFSERGILGENA